MGNRKNIRALSRIVLAVSGVAGAALLVPRAEGSLVLNLVFPNGTNSMTLTPGQQGQDFPILVYGTMTGVNPVTQTFDATTGNFDGISYAYYNVLSSVGVHALPGNVDNGAADSDYAPTLNGKPSVGSPGGTGFAAQGSQQGTVQDLNGDGVADLGSVLSIDQIVKPRSGPSIWNNTQFVDKDPTGAPDIIVSGSNNNTVSFLLETIYFQAGSSLAPGQSTSFSADPANTLQYGPYQPSNYFLDVPDIDPEVPPGPQHTFMDMATGTSVQFTVAVPEPATATAACLFTAGLLTRRRRRA